MKSIVYSCLLASSLWFLMFSPWTKGLVPFWAAMPAAAAVLAGISLAGQKGRHGELLSFRPRDIFTGLASAALLYGIFFAGNYLVTQVFTFGRLQVSGIYAIRSGISPLAAGVLLLLVIGPGEALFWQGFVQHRLGKALGAREGYLITCAVYCLVHVWAFNPTLLLASLVCGLFWGYMFMRRPALWPVIISHAVWDAVIFILLPIK